MILNLLYQYHKHVVFDRNPKVTKFDGGSGDSIAIKDNLRFYVGLQREVVLQSQAGAMKK